ncbi:hypothetical protein EVAR_18528_1 [Eumeta japonica]|uniref:ZAD domain-containing protein n=1 Tax=Eumeta variegata TaxID=151549 RepID=A0A4C1V3D0_EUMVA|nr:hypothetical protein EVAR_18528_1 [Eumeta japonica]
MSSLKATGPLINPGLCRCCRSIKKCRLMNIEYEWMGQKEIYSEMILDCFGLLLSSTENDNKVGVCATCVLRIRDASAFKKQVLQCEEIFLRKLHEVIEEDQQIDSDADNKPKTQEMTSDTESICDDNDEDPNYEPPDKKAITNCKRAEPRLIVGKKMAPKFSAIKTNQNKLIRRNVDKQLMHHKMEVTRRKLNKALKTSEPERGSEFYSPPDDALAFAVAEYLVNYTGGGESGRHCVGTTCSLFGQRFATDLMRFFFLSFSLRGEGDKKTNVLSTHPRAWGVSDSHGPKNPRSDLLVGRCP